MKIVSIEKCLEAVPNKFELALLASNRAKSILAGSPSKLEENDKDDKAAYISLKEIEENKTDLVEAKKELKEDILKDNLFIKSTTRKDALKSEDSFDDSDDNFNLDELMDNMEFDTDDPEDDDIDLGSEEEIEEEE